MKGEKTLKILEKIAEFASGVGDLIDAFLSVGYGASYGKLQREFSQKQRARSGLGSEKYIRQQYHNLIYKLKRDGLIEERQHTNRAVLRLTAKGKKKLTLLKEKYFNKLPENMYISENSPIFTVVAFDIPEKIKRKRAWLRDSLKNIGLKMIQKSVWIGKVKIPKEFLNDIKTLKLLNFVEIFEITKAGSLKHVT